MHSNYCLALTPAWPRRGFKFYLNNRIIYNCSSSGRCTDHGVLFKNTRIKAASDECKGLPFANINEDLTGKYTAIIEHPEELLTASFNLTLCNKERSEVKSMKLILRFRGQAAECVSQFNHESFCLTVENDGQHFPSKAFKCFLRDRLIYKCSENGGCTGHGILQHNVRPDYVTKDCYGIPFANVVPEATGKYTCIVEDDTLLIKADFDLHFCNETNNLHLHLKKNDVKVKCIDNKYANMNGYCLSIEPDKHQLYKEYNFTLNGSLVYDCDSSHSCSGKGILQERMGQNEKFIMTKGASGSCFGLPFINEDATMLGYYTVYAKTKSGSVVTDSYMVELCQGSSTVYNDTKAQTKETEDYSWSNTKLGIVIAVIIFAFVVGVIIAIYVKKKSPCLITPREDERDENSLPLNPRRCVS
ncbi:uncharacterized protein [Palaemon carinicauda]